MKSRGVVLEKSIARITVLGSNDGTYAPKQEVEERFEDVYELQFDHCSSQTLSASHFCY